MMHTRIIIAGSRKFNDYNMLSFFCQTIIQELKYEYKSTTLEIVSGTCSGADKLGEKFAKENNIQLAKFPADWYNLNVKPCFVKYNKLGKPYNACAGEIRNKIMAKYASSYALPSNGVLIAFWDMKSKGTKNMIDLAKKYNLKIFIININSGDKL